MQKQRQLVRNICLIAVVTAVTIVCAQIAIPLPGGVPFTLQTFAIALTGALLGPKYGVAAVMVYIALGAVGLPVFQNWTGGLHIIIGPTGGFIMSFPLMACCAGLGAQKNKRPHLAIGLSAGVVINLTAGMLWFWFIMSTTLQAAFMAVIAPFFLVEVAKMVAVFLVAPPVRKAL